MTGRKKNRCGIGYPCGGSCISRKRRCLNTLTGESHDYAGWLSSRTKSKKQSDLTGVDQFVAHGQSVVTNVLGQQFWGDAQRLTAEFSALEQQFKTVVQNPDYIKGQSDYLEKQDSYNRILAREENTRQRIRDVFEAESYGDIDVPEAQRQIDALEQELGAIGTERMALRSRLIREYREQSPLTQDLYRQRAEIERQAREYQNQLIESSALSREESLALVDRINLPEGWQSSAPNLREDMAAFYRLTNGQGSESLRTVELSADRAFATPEGDISIPGSNQTIIWHEMAHHAEFKNTSANAATQQFVRDRATGEPQPLRSITGNNNYEEDEIAYPDAFIDAYVGKRYENGATEVLSVGVERFSDPIQMIRLATRDPDHFALTLGIIRNPHRVMRP